MITESQHACRMTPRAKHPLREAHLRARARAGAFLALGAAALLAGCGIPATFVSTETPPEACAEAWYKSAPGAVSSALVESMMDADVTVMGADAAVVRGLRQQVPFVDDDVAEPASGRLPHYEFVARLHGDDRGTYVHAHVVPTCEACDGETAYEWEYPSDLLRGILRAAARRLGERSPRFEFPERCSPPGSGTAQE